MPNIYNLGLRRRTILPRSRLVVQLRDISRFQQAKAMDWAEIGSTVGLHGGDSDQVVAARVDGDDAA